MIPKVIHYCWFGKKKKPIEIIQCINSWKSILVDYEIIEWNEENSDLSHTFVNHFYNEKKWAFVSDYIRLNVLYNQGGIYLDTDILVIKKFDELLNNKLFFGAENDNFINASVVGAQKNNLFIAACLKEYNSLNYENSLMDLTIPKIITSLFVQKYKISSFNKIIALDSITIYPKNYFYPFPISKKLEQNTIHKYITNETFAIHLWFGSWIDNQEFYFIRNKRYAKGLKIILSKMNKIDIKYIRKVLSAFRDSLK